MRSLLVCAVVLMLGCNQQKPILISKKRVVATNVGNIEAMRAEIATPGASVVRTQVEIDDPSKAPPPVAPCGDPRGIVTADAEDGEYVIINLSFAKDYLAKMRSTIANRDTFSSRDFELRTESEMHNPIILIPGNYEKDAAGEHVNLYGYTASRLNDGTFTPGKKNELAKEVEKAVGPVFSSYLEDMKKLKPKSLKDNFWAGRVELTQDAGWAASEIILLFKLPKDRDNMKLVTFSDFPGIPLKLKASK